MPFHMWAPDVYEGAPTTITAMLAAGSKKMGFVAAVQGVPHRPDRHQGGLEGW